jgi:hypothetical protein
MKRKAVTTIAVTVNGREWSRALSFRNARPDDAIYVLDQRDGAIRFGDGSHGRTPLSAVPSASPIAMGPDLLETFPNILMTRETSRIFGLSCVAGIRPSGGESDRAEMLPGP